ncbi:hypothetical protein SUDANB95_06635 [Actinosynnema sp. ALI-1.44]
MNRLRHSPYVPHRDNVRGFVYDVHTGGLTEVVQAGNPGGPVLEHWRTL